MFKDTSAFLESKKQERRNSTPILVKIEHYSFSLYLCLKYCEDIEALDHLEEIFSDYLVVSGVKVSSELPDYYSKSESYEKWKFTYPEILTTQPEKLSFVNILVKELSVELGLKYEELRY